MSVSKKLWSILKESRWKYSWLLCFFVLLPFVSFQSTLDPELQPRIFLISLLCFFFYLFQIWAEIKINYPTKRILFISSLIIGVTGLSIVNSINTGEAISELLRIFMVYSVLFISILVFSNQKQNPVLLTRFISISLLIFHCIAIIDAIPIIQPFFSSGKINLFQNITSTLSNKNFFSELLVILLPVSMFGIRNDKSYFRILYIFNLFFSLIFIFILYSIACWIAFAISFALVAFFYFKYYRVEKGNKTKFNLTVIFITILLPILFFTIKNPLSVNLISKISFAKEYLLHPNLTNQYSVENNNSVFDRLLLVRNSLEMIKDHPFFGAGLNNWKLLFPKYGVQGTEVIVSGVMNFEHPHNDYLLIIAEQGIIGLLFYLWFFIYVLRVILKEVRTSQKQEFIYVILWAVIAFIIIGLFSYPRSRIYTPASLMILIGYLFSGSGSLSNQVFTIKKYHFILLSMISFFTIIVFWIRLQSEIAAKDMMVSRVKQNFARVIRSANTVNQYFYPVEINTTSIEWYIGMANFYSRNMSEALIHFQKAYEITPFHLRTLNDLATTYEQNGQLDKAIQFYTKSIQISPSFDEARLNQIATYFNNSMIDSAIFNIQRLNVIALTPNNFEKYVSFADVIIMKKLADSAAVNKNPAYMNRYYEIVRDHYSLNQYIRNYRGKNILKDLFYK